MCLRSLLSDCILYTRRCVCTLNVCVHTSLCVYDWLCQHGIVYECLNNDLKVCASIRRWLLCACSSARGNLKAMISDCVTFLKRSDVMRLKAERCHDKTECWLDDDWMLTDKKRWYWMLTDKKRWYWMLTDKRWYWMLTDKCWYWMLTDKKRWYWMLTDKRWYWMLTHKKRWYWRICDTNCVKIEQMLMICTRAEWTCEGINCCHTNYLNVSSVSLSHMPCVTCLVSHALCYMPYATYLVLHTWCHLPVCHMPYVTSHALCHMPCVTYLVSSTLCHRMLTMRT